MPSKIKINKLTIFGFRGANKSISLDCTSDFKNIVLFGNNGDGKTTFSDSIEWFYTDKIEYLTKEGCGKEDYPNRYLLADRESTVELSFNETTLNCQKSYKKKKASSFSTRNTDFSTYISTSSKETPILRHHTMRDFVDKTKKEKLERLEEIVGFNIVLETRDTLLKALNALKDDREFIGLLGQRKERKGDLIKIVGKDDFNEGDIVTCADRLAKICDAKISVNNTLDFQNAVERFTRQISTSTKGKEIEFLEKLKTDLTSLLGLYEVFQGIDSLISEHNKLAEEQRTIEAAAIEKLYKAAIDAFDTQSVKVGECPLCKQTIDTDKLLISLKQEVSEIGKALLRRNAIVGKARHLKEKLNSSKSGLTSFLKLETAFRKLYVSDTLDKAIQLMSALLQNNESIFNSIEQYPRSVTALSLDSLGAFTKEISLANKSVDNKIGLITETDAEKKFYESAQALKSLLENHKRFLDLTKEIDKYEKQINSLHLVSDGFEKMEMDSLKNILAALSKDVNDFFKFLHPDDNIDEVELVPTDARGIEFKLKYHGEEITPPRRILSEAHLNSLGICLFLASARYFNKVNGFLVLDDVVTSFDMGHRRPLARLLDEKFPETQFFLFTHDDLWFDLLKKDLAQNKWIFKELVKWTKENGVDLKDSPITLKERIILDLANNDVPGASNKCRTLIEETLKEVCAQLGVKSLEFRTGSSNDKREANELINALESYLKSNQTLREKSSKQAFNHLRASQLITNIGSHHQNLITSSLNRGDVSLVVKDIDALNALFVCPNCKTGPNKKYSPLGSDLKYCKCGDFKV